jgi:hypothetical protein
MRHYRHGGRIGRALRIGLKWIQLINGISSDSFEHPNRLLPHAVGSWFISIRQYLTASGFGLKLTKPLYTASTRRTHDKVLMDDVLHIVKTPTKIQQINKVRLFLRVECLSEICTANGLELLESLWAPQPFTESQTMKFWPRQNNPGKTTWTAWYEFIKQYTKDEKRQLRQELGTWTDLSNYIKKSLFKADFLSLLPEEEE